MRRPPSIVRFEALYLAAFVLGLVATALSWQAMQALLASDPRLAAMGWFMPVITIVRVLLVLLFWWLAARRASVVGKWGAVVVAVFAGINLIGGVIGWITGSVGPLTSLFTIVGDALYIIAAVYLFRPDAAVWFGEVQP